VSESRIESLLLACDEYRHAVVIAMACADRVDAQLEFVLQANERLQARLSRLLDAAGVRP
jgi:hypothetical protein